MSGRALGMGLAALLALLVLGGCARRHLHPRFGRASKIIWTEQTAKRQGHPRAQLTGEEVEIVVTNHKRSYTVSETKGKGGGGIGVLPLQR